MVMDLHAPDETGSGPSSYPIDNTAVSRLPLPPMLEHDTQKAGNLRAT